MNGCKSLVINHHNLSDLVKRQEIEIARDILIEQLDKGHITRIINAFLNNTLIYDNGWAYFKVNGLSSILRTSNSGIERSIVYNGISRILGPSEIIEIKGEDYISQHDFIKLLSYRMTSISLKKTELYLRIANEIYFKIINNPLIKDLNLLFNQKIEEKRTDLKKLRLEKYNITHCEFTGALIEDFDDYQFAHLDAVAYNPTKALDIDNGVIIHKDIHSEMTDLGLNTELDIYLYCKQNEYLLKWTKIYN